MSGENKKVKTEAERRKTEREEAFKALKTLSVEETRKYLSSLDYIQPGGETFEKTNVRLLLGIHDSLKSIEGLLRKVVEPKIEPMVYTEKKPETTPEPKPQTELQLNRPKKTGKKR